MTIDHLPKHGLLNMTKYNRDRQIYINKLPFICIRMLVYAKLPQLLL